MAAGAASTLHAGDKLQVARVKNIAMVIGRNEDSEIKAAWLQAAAKETLLRGSAASKLLLESMVSHLVGGRLNALGKRNSGPWMMAAWIQVTIITSVVLTYSWG